MLSRDKLGTGVCLQFVNNFQFLFSIIFSSFSHTDRPEHWQIQLKRVSLKVSAVEKVTASSHHTRVAMICSFTFPSEFYSHCFSFDSVDALEAWRQ